MLFVQLFVCPVFLQGYKTNFPLETIKLKTVGGTIHCRIVKKKYLPCTLLFYWIVLKVQRLKVSVNTEYSVGEQ